MNKKKTSYPAGSEKRKFIEAMLSKMGADQDVQFEFTSRDLESFVGGKLAGDCTKLGEINDWTLGAWNLTFENMELRVKVKGKFFARVIFIASLKEGKDSKSSAPVLYAHAIEFSPLARPNDSTTKSSLSDPALQMDALTKTLRFLHDHASKAGFSDVVLTTISNSGEYNPIMESFAGAKKIEPHKMQLRLLNPLDSAHSIQKELRRGDAPVSILLQDWQAGTKFDKGKSIEYRDATALTMDGKTIDREDYKRAANLCYQFFKDRTTPIKRSLSFIRNAADKELYHEDYIDKNWDKFVDALRTVQDHGYLGKHKIPSKMLKSAAMSLKELKDDSDKLLGVLDHRTDMRVYDASEFSNVLIRSGLSPDVANTLSKEPKQLLAEHEAQIEREEEGKDEKLPTTINSPVKAYSLNDIFPP